MFHLIHTPFNWTLSDMNGTQHHTWICRFVHFVTEANIKVYTLHYSLSEQHPSKLSSTSLYPALCAKFVFRNISSSFSYNWLLQHLRARYIVLSTDSWNTLVVAAVADNTSQCVAMTDVTTPVSVNCERKLAVMVERTLRWLTREHANVSNIDLSLNRPRFLLEFFSQ